MNAVNSTAEHIAVFASGTGSNTQKIIDYFREHAFIKISLIVCNKPGAGVLQIAENEKIPSLLLEKEKFFGSDFYAPGLNARKISFIVLAGFLWKIPSWLLELYPGRIINIHPALLPEFGGKGMYGNKVHAAVIEAGKKESGISIHFVDDQYDHGPLIFQARCSISQADTPGSLAQKIHALEYEHYPRIIEKVLTNLQNPS